jgi:hypothetical protein
MTGFGIGDCSAQRPDLGAKRKVINWAGCRQAAFGSTNAQSGLSGYDPIAAISAKCSNNLQACF